MVAQEPPVAEQGDVGFPGRVEGAAAARDFERRRRRGCGQEQECERQTEDPHVPPHLGRRAIIVSRAILRCTLT